MLLTVSEILKITSTLSVDLFISYPDVRAKDEEYRQIINKLLDELEFRLTDNIHKLMSIDFNENEEFLIITFIENKLIRLRTVSGSSDDIVSGLETALSRNKRESIVN